MLERITQPLFNDMAFSKGALYDSDRPLWWRTDERHPDNVPLILAP